MKERPILFSGEMVRAILEGRKAQTRRIVQVQPPSTKYQFTTLADSTARKEKKHIGAHHWAVVKDLNIVEDHGEYFRCPYGYPGDRLWVRETWATDASLNDKAPSQFSKWPVIYVADNKVNMCGALHGNTGGKIRQSIFMPRWASRITLEITCVRVERLQEITEADAQAEGVAVEHAGVERSFGEAVALARFRILWDQINGKRASWESNPWVWVVDFKRMNNGTI